MKDLFIKLQYTVNLEEKEEPQTFWF